MPEDPVAALLSQPIKLQRTTAPVLSDTVIERRNNPVTYTPSQKLPYMTYDKLMKGSNDVYDPLDFPVVGQRIRDNVVKAIESRFPVVGEAYTLKVENVHYEKPKQTELREEKDVLLHEGTLQDRLKGDWVLYDNKTGKEIQRKKTTLLNVPRMTDRGTFIRNGAELGLKHMFRLRSGVYTHIKNNGQVSAHINPEQTTGQQMAIDLDQATGILSVSRGTRTYGLLPLMKAAGVPDEAVKKVLGEELYNVNYDKYRKMMDANSPVQEEYRALWNESIAPIKLDPETTASTLGKAFDKMDPDVFLRASGRVLQVSKTMSDLDTDDRDSLRYQRIMGPADYIPERIIRDGGGLLRRLFNTVIKDGNLDAVNTGAFQPQVDSVFMDDKHAGYIDGSSPLESMDFAAMVSRIGEGGIGSLRAAPAETRAVNDSYINYIDSIRSPECYAEGTELFTKAGWKKVEDCGADDLFACLVEGRLEYHKAEKFTKSFYNGVMCGYRRGNIDYLVTPNHRMYTRCLRPRRDGTPCSYIIKEAREIHGRERQVMIAGHLPYLGDESQRVFHLPPVAPNLKTEQIHGNPPIGANTRNIDEIDICDFAEFMGWYLSEGTFVIDEKRGYYRVDICQSPELHKDNWDRILRLVKSLPFGAYKEDTQKYKEDRKVISIGRKQLAVYLSQFGKSETKFIPSWIFEAPLAARKRFREAMLLGDGRNQRHLCTMSKRLAEDFARLQIDLGESVIVHHEPEKRFKDHPGIWVVYWHSRNCRQLTSKKKQNRQTVGGYYTVDYSGYVYCPTVPGGLVYCRKGDSTNGFWCGNSLKVGLDVYMTHGVMKDSAGNLYNKFKDKSGKVVVVPMNVAAASIVATPEFYDPKGDPDEFIPAMYQGKGIEYVKRKDVDFFVDNSNNMLSLGAGMIPLIGGIRSNRTLMGCLDPETSVVVVQLFYLDSGITEVNTYNITARELLENGYQKKDDVYLVSLDLGTPCFRKLKGVHKVTENLQLYEVSIGSGITCKVNGIHRWKCKVLETSSKDTVSYLTTEEIKKLMDEGERVVIPYIETQDHKFLGNVLTATYGSGLVTDKVIKSIEPAGKAEYLVDIDVNDNVYLLSNGMFTHNSKYGNQAVPLTHGESPLVQRKLTLNDGEETTTERFIGRQLGARFAPMDGVITSMDNDSITMRGRDGQLHHIDLYNDYPANQKGYISSRPLVKPGDRVHANQILAATNYTDDEGTAALGTNLRVAFLTGRNAGTFEDSIQISETAAKTKLASTQLYKLRGETTDDIEYSKSRYLSLFKDDFTPEQLDKIDDNGLPKVGVVFEEGDPVYLGVQKREIGVHGLAKNAAVPYVTRWEHEDPGTVTNVIQGKKHLTVYTKCVTPMKVGDKLCFDSETEVLTDKGWKFFKDLNDTERVMTLELSTGETYLTTYSERFSYDYKGKMYSLRNEFLDICVTPDHKNIVTVNTNTDYVRIMTSKEVFGKTVFHITGQNVLNPHNFKPSKTKQTREEWIDYNGKVYCLTVPYTHTMFVRRHGKTWWSGNSARYGNKGVCGEIVPDDQMPRDSEGRPFDIIQSPLGIVSRLNGSQLAELQLAKIAQKTGKPYSLPDFMPESIVDFTDNEMKKYGVEPDEDVYDPVTGKTIPNVQTGVLFYYKLKHMAELKERGRGTGQYSSEDVPLKGSGAARRFGTMETSAVYSGGGMEVLRDAKIVRGQRNDEFWRDYRSGKYPETPGFPLVHQKFFAHLKAAGINLEDRGDRIHIYGQTNSDLRKLTGDRQVTKAATYDSKKMQPVAGGLFDPTIFGVNGDQWGYVELPEPVLNPMMFKPIASILGWKDKELSEYLSGERKLDGKFGSQNLIDTLKKIDLPKELAKAKQVLKSQSTTLEQRDMARKRLRAIEPMLREGKTPEDFFVTRMPILPPRFRPVTEMSNGVGIAADINFLYKRAMDAIDDLVLAKKELPEELQLDARRELYNSINAVTGLQPTDDPKLEAKGVAGALRWAFGKGSPKLGSLHRKVFGANLDLGSLNVITPDNSMSIDQVGIPEASAWKMFEPFVVRRLVQGGSSVINAMKSVLDQTPEAKRALVEVMRNRPILLNRAPTLWRYGIQGQYPVLVKGTAIRINPNICKLYNADFDGDTCIDFVNLLFSEEIFKNSLEIFNNHVILGNSNTKPSKEGSMIKKSEKMSLVGLRCAIGDVPVLEDTMREVNENVTEWDVCPGIYTECINKDTGEQLLAEITKLSLHKNVDMYDISLETYGCYKHVITVSKDGTLLTYKDGKIAITDASEALGAVIPRAKYIGKVYGTNIQAKCIDIGKKYSLSYDLGLFLGMMIGDGWVDENFTVHLAAENEEIQKEFMRITDPETGCIDTRKPSKLFGNDTERFGGPIAHRFTVYMEKGAPQILRRLIGSGAHNKKIPAFCLAASRAHRLGLLAGLIATDGSVQYSEKSAKGKKTAQRGILFHTTSQLLRDGIIELCRTLGVRASATSYMGTNSKVPCYAINLSVRDMANLQKQVPGFHMITKHDQTAFEGICKTANAVEIDPYDPVPYPSHLKALMAQALYDILPVNELNRYRKRGYISRGLAKKLVVALKEFDYSSYEEKIKAGEAVKYTPSQVKQLAEDWIRLVENEDVQWEVVTDVNYIGKMDGWDLTVPGPLTFTLGSGTFVQDSMTTHVPVSNEAIKAINEHMLPSRNLLSPIDNKAHFIPRSEFAQGLYLASRTRKESPIRFKSKEDMMAALKRGEIKVDTPVIIG